MTFEKAFIQKGARRATPYPHQHYMSLESKLIIPAQNHLSSIGDQYTH